MKKIVKMLTVLLALMMLTGSASAQSLAQYDGGAEVFVFEPGSELSKSDLFADFYNVLPGDVLTRTIRVENNVYRPIRVYLRAEPVSEADKDFLDQLLLHVTAADTTIFDAPAGETAQLTDAQLLGTFKRKGGTELVVTLTVPAEMDGEEFMGRVGKVPWTFIVEELDDPDSPNTGDSFDPLLWGGAAGMILLAIAFVLVMEHKRRARG